MKRKFHTILPAAAVSACLLTVGCEESAEVTEVEENTPAAAAGGAAAESETVS
ncbi:MAG: hypothetical protein HKO57_01235, partial [Akkermansiaceae bacterium]|nr:hypothetical protein [Akkermansiaceae bacterium]